MRKATELMVKYAAYHRDRRNIATHFVGVPMIVFAIISVRGSSRSLTQRVCNACSYASAYVIRSPW